MKTDRRLEQLQDGEVACVCVCVYVYEIVNGRSTSIYMYVGGWVMVSIYTHT
jgi:hypothetical protein